MIELLKDVGFPSFLILALALVSIILWRYYEHRLEKLQKKHEIELELIGEIHRDRYSTISSIYRHLAELYHNLSNLYHSEEEAQSRRPAIQKYRSSLRSLVREKSLILGANIKDMAYDLTDYANAVELGECQFDNDKWFKLDRRIRQECNAILNTIPSVEGEISKTKVENGLHSNQDAK